jgi:cytidylate kinase
MGTMASLISVDKKVRLYLVKLQQDLAKENPVVMDGRDIGTHVLPDAKLKIYLTATSEVRAQRRFLQMSEKGENVEFEILKKEIEDRDYRDMNRDFAPLKQADDAILLDTSYMTIDEVVETIYSLAKERE